MIGLRGKIVPIVDIAARLGLPGEGAADGKVIILDERLVMLHDAAAFAAVEV